jgi:hypothetical protein
MQWFAKTVKNAAGEGRMIFSMMKNETGKIICQSLCDGIN